MRQQLTLATCVLLLAMGAHAKAPKAAASAVGVNWVSEVVRATGSGAPDFKAQNPAQARLGAERVALAEALRNLVTQVKGISVDGSRTVGQLMEKDEIRTQVEGVLRGYSLTSKRYFSDSGVEIEVEVPLAALNDVIDPNASQLVVAKPSSGLKRNTGLIIDARGLKVTPSLMPRLLDAQGQPVYSIDFLSADARKLSAVAAFVPRLEDAQKSRKVGEKPIIVKAKKAAGADLHLGADETKKLASLDTSFLADGKVIIIFN